jgi:hypothetical protein
MAAIKKRAEIKEASKAPPRPKPRAANAIQTSPVQPPPTQVPPKAACKQPAVRKERAASTHIVERKENAVGKQPVERKERAASKQPAENKERAGSKSKTTPQKPLKQEEIRERAAAEAHRWAQER